MPVAEPLVPSAELIRRVREAECRYTDLRLGVLAALPGNPVGVERRRIGEAWAFRAQHLPMEAFNRVVGLTDAQAGEVAGLAEWFADNGSSGRFEVAPGAPMDALARALASAGYAQTSFHATLCGEVGGETIPNNGVQVEEVTTPAVLEAFLDTYGAGWGIPPEGRDGFKANVRGWLGQPGWRLYLARCDGTPAGEAILYLHDGVGYLADSAVHPDFRGRGVHRALIDRRRTDARVAGADLLCVQAAYLSTSHRNMVRAGLNLLYAQTYWTPPA